jgi:hypothetical protein
VTKQNQPKSKPELIGKHYYTFLQKIKARYRDVNKKKKLLTNKMSFLMGELKKKQLKNFRTSKCNFFNWSNFFLNNLYKRLKCVFLIDLIFFIAGQLIKRQNIKTNTKWVFLHLDALYNSPNSSLVSWSKVFKTENNIWQSVQLFELEPHQLIRSL